jgi:hypothetical protein
VTDVRGILNKATPGPWPVTETRYSDDYSCWGTAVEPTEANAQLAALAPELAALVLDMGEELRRSLPQDESMDHGRDPDRRALLARLDQLGKGPGDE